MIPSLPLRVLYRVAPGSVSAQTQVESMIPSLPLRVLYRVAPGSVSAHTQVESMIPSLPLRVLYRRPMLSRARMTGRCDSRRTKQMRRPDRRIRNSPLHRRESGDKSPHSKASSRTPSPGAGRSPGLHPGHPAFRPWEYWDSRAVAYRRPALPGGILRP